MRCRVHRVFFFLYATLPMPYPHKTDGAVTMICHSPMQYKIFFKGITQLRQPIRCQPRYGRNIRKR